MPRKAKTRYLLPIQIEELEGGQFLGRSPKLPGLNVQADSIEQVLKLAPKVARTLIEAMRAKGVRIPTGLAHLRTPLNVKVLVTA